jgi:hypothetical protein
VTAGAAMERSAVTHHLCAAFRFVDAFTGRPVGVPLDVRADTMAAVPGMPNTPWKAVAGPNDGTYRFLVTNRTVMPAGAIAVSVEAPGGEYVSFEPVTMTLPRPLAAHPPTPDRSDFLVGSPPWPAVAVPLWPTRLVQLPAGETAIVGMVKSGGATPTAGLRIKIWDSRDPMPATPYTYTDASGEFLFRLPADMRFPGIRFKGGVSGGVITSTANLVVDIRIPPAYAAAVAPTAPAVPFSVRLGQLTTMPITVP